jgi:hypothetical protein
VSEQTKESPPEPSAVQQWARRLAELREQAALVVRQVGGHLRTLPQPQDEKDAGVLLELRAGLGLPAQAVPDKQIESAAASAVGPLRNELSYLQGAFREFLQALEGGFQAAGKEGTLGIAAFGLHDSAVEICATGGPGLPARRLAVAHLASLPEGHVLKSLSVEECLGANYLSRHVVLGEAVRRVDIYTDTVWYTAPAWVSLKQIRSWTAEAQKEAERRAQEDRGRVNDMNRRAEELERARRLADAPARLAEVERELARLKKERQGDHAYLG